MVMGKNLVFVDILSARHEITYDGKSRTSRVSSTISFQVKNGGHPVFDFSGNWISGVFINGEKSEFLSHSIAGVTQDANTRIRYLSTHVGPGVHTLTAQTQSTKNLQFSDLDEELVDKHGSDLAREDAASVRNAFFFSDLEDRQFLEQYMVSNLEYDHHPIEFFVSLENLKREHVIYTNGSLVEAAPNKFLISYPDYFTSSSIYYHIAPKGAFPEEAMGVYRSIDGRDVLVRVYAAVGGETDKALSHALEMMAELESAYGEYPFAELLIYLTEGGGGMEYCGATATSLWALSHEISHMYHARSMMPKDGNAGWMDEAIASWRDANYEVVEEGILEPVNLDRRGAYARTTSYQSYTEGRNFISFLAGLFDSKGRSLKSVLGDYYKKYIFQSVGTAVFRRELSSAFGEDLNSYFDKYTTRNALGKVMALRDKSGFEVFFPGRHHEAPDTMVVPQKIKFNPYHPPLTKEQLRKML